MTIEGPLHSLNCGRAEWFSPTLPHPRESAEDPQVVPHTLAGLRHRGGLWIAGSFGALGVGLHLPETRGCYVTSYQGFSFKPVEPALRRGEGGVWNYLVRWDPAGRRGSWRWGAVWAAVQRPAVPRASGVSARVRACVCVCVTWCAYETAWFCVWTLARVIIVSSANDQVKKLVFKSATWSQNENFRARNWNGGSEIQISPLSNSSGETVGILHFHSGSRKGTASLLKSLTNLLLSVYFNSGMGWCQGN